jgi:hypothetical protein
MAREKRIPPHLILVNSLQSWSHQYGTTEDPYLTQLLEAVKNRKNLPMWASLDPLEYLPHAEVETNRRLHLLALVIAITRNALVFLPVALTWFAISQATSAFASYTANNTLSVVNFLDFWENGYGALSHTWALSNVAVYDFGIVLLIIVLTIFISLLDRSLKEMRNRAVQVADEERISMALSISTYLFDQQRVTNVTVNHSLARVLRDILNSTESLEKTSKELNRTVKDIPSNREMLKEIKNIKARIFQRSWL